MKEKNYKKKVERKLASKWTRLHNDFDMFCMEW